jgi:hypothetical protein
LKNYKKKEKEKEQEREEQERERKLWALVVKLSGGERKSWAGVCCFGGRRGGGEE